MQISGARELTSQAGGFNIGPRSLFANNMTNEFTRRARDAIRSIPRGKVASYGFIAALAGDGRQARQISWILHSSSDKERLPWHRVVSASGRISLPHGRGGREQKRRLQAEGVSVGRGGTIDLRKYGWDPVRLKSPALSRLDLDKLGGD